MLCIAADSAVQAAIPPGINSFRAASNAALRAVGSFPGIRPKKAICLQFGMPDGASSSACTRGRRGGLMIRDGWQFSVFGVDTVKVNYRQARMDTFHVSLRNGRYTKECQDTITTFFPLRFQLLFPSLLSTGGRGTVRQSYARRTASR